MKGMEEKPEIQINEEIKPRKISPFGCPPIPPSTKWRSTVFQCLKTPKTSRTYPRWERDLMEQKRQVWLNVGSNMNYIHVKFQDLQQKRAGVR